jgi:PAT family beta-lactamase induction signal transducer AmpG
MQAWLAKSGLDVKRSACSAWRCSLHLQVPVGAVHGPLHLGPLGRRRGWMALTQLALFLYRRLGMLGNWNCR